MARNYILGGMAGTQLQAGKPYFKRIVRIDGRGQTDINNLVPARADGLTCNIDNDGKINFDGAVPADWNANTQHGVQNADPDHKGGELLMVEFPTTLRSVQIQLEEASDKVRAKIMLTAPAQDTKADGQTPNIASPVADGNYIEIKSGETATISSRTKVVFILIQKYADVKIFNGGALTVGEPGAAGDTASILVTGVLDHEPTSGGSQAANEPNSIVIDANGDERSLRKIWGASDGIG